MVEWINPKIHAFEQLKKPSHPIRGIPSAINCLATLLREPMVRSSFVQADGVKLLVPLISPASTQQSIQVLVFCLLLLKVMINDFVLFFLTHAIRILWIGNYVACFSFRVSQILNLLYDFYFLICASFHSELTFSTHHSYFLEQLLYETCLCVWLLSYYEPAVEYLATSRALPRLTEVVKGSTKEKVSPYPSYHTKSNATSFNNYLLALLFLLDLASSLHF